MAYFNQEKKAKIAPAIKALAKQYGVKASLAVHNHSTVVLNITSGKIDFFKEYNRDKVTYLHVNEFYIETEFNGIAKEFLVKAKEILDTDNFDKSDTQSDYFHVGHYTDINIGLYNKPYIVI
jgi:hypothetical protein